MTRKLPAVLALAAIFLASACSGSFLPGQAPPPKLFDLTPKSTFDAEVSNVAQDMAYGLRFEDRLDWMERNLVGARDKLAAITENFDRLLKADSGLNR